MMLALGLDVLRFLKKRILALSTSCGENPDVVMQMNGLAFFQGGIDFKWEKVSKQELIV